VYCRPDAGFEIFNRMFQGWKGTSWEMSTELSNFLAGGLASNMYWGMALRELRLERELIQRWIMSRTG
jgi:hypothetical protein